ncbi:hypothetical protein Aperf_G00000075035 [Anoplocephala perfoliata]
MVSGLVGRSTSFPSGEEEPMFSPVLIQLEQHLEETSQSNELLSPLAQVFKTGCSFTDRNVRVINEAIKRCLASPELNVNGEIVHDAVIFLGNMPRTRRHSDYLASNVAKFILKAADSLHLNVIRLVKDLIGLRNAFDNSLVYLFDDCNYSSDFRQLTNMISEFAQSFVHEFDDIAEIYQICCHILCCSSSIPGFRSDLWIPGIVTAYLEMLVESDYKKDHEEQLFYVNSIGVLLMMIAEQKIEVDKAIIEELQAVLRLFKVVPEESIMEVLKMNREFFETENNMMVFKLFRKWRKVLKLISVKVRQDVPQCDAILAIEGKEKPEFKGLRNLSFNCYINAVLQMLHYHTSFRRAFDSICSEVSVGEEGVVHRSLRNLFKSLASTSSDKVVNPASFVDLTRPEHFPANTEQDAVEYLDHLLNLLKCEAVVEGESDSSSYVSKVFDIPVICTHSCTTCGRELTRNEGNHRFLMLHLNSNAPQADGKVADHPFLQSTQEMIDSLYTERIEETEKCEYCDGENGVYARNAVTEIKAAPSTLLLNVTLFRFDKVSQTALKNLSKFEVNEVVTLLLKANFGRASLKQVLNGTNELNEHLKYIYEVFAARNPLDNQQLQKLNGELEHCLALSMPEISEDIAKRGVIFLGNLPDLHRQSESLVDNISKFILKANVFLANGMRAILVMIEEQSTVLDTPIAVALWLVRGLFPEEPDESVLDILKRITINFLETHKGEMPKGDTALVIEDNEELKCRGLTNTSHNCYVNTILQMLYYHASFRRAFDSICSEVSVDGKGMVHRSLRNLFKSLASTPNSQAVDPSSFVDLTRPEHFPANTEQDAVEYLDHLLNLLKCEAVVEGEGDSSSYVSKVFDIPVICTHSCTTCGRELTRNEGNHRFLMLHLNSNAPQADGEVADHPFLQSTQEMIDSLYTERIEETEKCEYCDGENGVYARNAVTEIKAAPSTLLLNVKLFRFDKASQTALKNLSKFEVNEVVTLILNGNTECQYNLWGIILHSGVSLDGGHYVWVCSLDGQWILFNDERVFVVSLEELLKNALLSPYLIVYTPKGD